MAFDRMLENLHNGVNIELENVDITDDFRVKYEEYKENAKNRQIDGIDD